MDHSVLGKNVRRVDSSNLKIKKAKETVEAISFHEDFTFVDCFVREFEDAHEEIIIVSSEPGIIQRPVVDVRFSESLALMFHSADNWYPEVLSLRDDFPDVIHLNLQPKGEPKSICIYTEDFQDKQLSWTATDFLNRISAWFVRTAKGELHGEDQPLEPFLLSSKNNLIIPPNFFELMQNNSYVLSGYLVPRKDNKASFIVKFIEKQTFSNWIKQSSIKNSLPKFSVLFVEGLPKTHGKISHIPRNVGELSEFLSESKIDLLAELREFIKSSYKNKSVILADEFLIVLASLPKKRHKASANAERKDFWAFILDMPIEKVGINIDAISKSPQSGEIVTDIFGIKTNIDAISEVPVDVLKPVMDVSSESLAFQNTIKKECTYKKFVMIGAGALGSHILSNFIRMAYGDWSLVDDDYLLPHNVSKHVLGAPYIGHPKTAALSNEFAQVFNLPNKIKPFDENYMLEHSKDLTTSLKEAEFIIDASTSIAVARKLALENEFRARKISIFLSPSGSSSIYMIEDEEKNTPIDSIEAQYYQWIISDPIATDHLALKHGTIRYGRSCRDVSNRIPQDSIAFHSASLCKRIRSGIENNSAQLSILSSDQNDQIVNFSIELAKPRFYSVCGWTIISNEKVETKVHKLRYSRLPNETGGVLIGYFDTYNKRVYIVDCLPAPNDSTEKPDYFVRGTEGLQDAISNIKQKTLEQVDYIGEWHSHPNSTSIQPSCYDLKLLAKLKKDMFSIGYPALILISGEDCRLNWIIQEL